MNLVQYKPDSRPIVTQDSVGPSRPPNRARPKVGVSDIWAGHLARRLIHSRLQHLKYGRLTIVSDNRVQVFGDMAPNCSLATTLHVYDDRFYADLVFGGSIGAGEAYIQSSWSVENLTTLVQIMLRNREVLDQMESGWVRIPAILREFSRRLTRNTRRRSAKNISAHYDLGNEFFEIVLRSTMMYSCAWFERPNTRLEEAATANLDRICRGINLQPDDHIIEIGTGWGTFALHAARHYGCKVTTTTISKEQYTYSKARVIDAGLSERINILLSDYRDLNGQYDKVVSIEMVEHVGHQYYKTYFQQCANLLKPGGFMFLQASTIAEERYRAALNSVDFIQRYIFPGGCMPAVSVLCETAGHARLRLTQFEDIASHYEQTLDRWRSNLLANIGAIRSSGYKDDFIRAWLFYLGYCQGGFTERALGAAQMRFVKSA